MKTNHGSSEIWTSPPLQPYHSLNHVGSEWQLHGRRATTDAGAALSGFRRDNAALSADNSVPLHYF